MNGLKRVRVRRDDALTQVDWRQLEVLLAVYYRGQGYEVEHVGTGATGARADGGVDLKLRRSDEYVLVQVKHWNACQVPHNDVHQLLGIMVNEGATGAVLVTSGEFTKAAIEAATRQGHVQLIDGEELRALLGPLPESAAEPRTPMSSRSHGHQQGNEYAVSRRGELHDRAGAFARIAGERLLDAAEDRIRYGREGRSLVRVAATTGLKAVLLKVAIAAGLGVVMWIGLQSALRSLEAGLAPRPTPSATGIPSTAQPMVSTAGRYVEAAGTQSPPHSEPAYTPPREPTAAEIRESQRRADEAVRVLEATTPEM